MKIALIQINPTIGDFDGNVDLMLDQLERAQLADADLAMFPELATTGYPPRDLLLREGFIAGNDHAVARLAHAAVDIALVVGCVTRNDSGGGLPLFNTAAFCADGQVHSRHHKCLLPNYDVFDERRYFQTGATTTPVTWSPQNGRPLKLGICVCEDLWYDQATMYRFNPAADLVRQGAELLINLSASPFCLGKQAERHALFTAAARRHGVPIACVNQVGGNDELLFDGGSMFIDGRGRLCGQAAAFEEDMLIVDTDAPGNLVQAYPEDIDSLRRALVVGTRDYVRKCGFSEVLVGLSGGIDSAVTAALAVEALGADAVHGVAMPSRYSSEHSIEDAGQLAESLGIEFRVIPITGLHSATEDTLAAAFDGRMPGVAAENMQARARGQILMSLSNEFGWLLLTTGNKSELAVGYCTLYGDMCGGLSVISDVAKTQVYALARHINQGSEFPIPINTITKPPSAELRPGQTDQDSLPPYNVLDDILHRYVELHQDVATIVASGHLHDVVSDVVRRVDLNEYKRRQAAPGLRVTSRAFGIGRRMPVAAMWPQHAPAPDRV